MDTTTMDADVEAARRLMFDFAARTGLSSDLPPQRYLWTDAFAVCNFLALFTASGDREPLELAERLVEQVHGVLGSHRADDPRRGPISGLPAEQARLHPTAGGLRIGKPLPERAPDEPFDERTEMQRDGQYFHYLTKWMHALERTATATGDARHRRHARELACVAHDAFTRHAARGRMVWKASIDLSRPLVPSMGQHDPLDAFVTFRQLEAADRDAAADAGAADRDVPDLTTRIENVAGMLRSVSLPTSDPLGIGGLLFDACRLAQLGRRGDDKGLVDALLEAALLGLSYYGKPNPLDRYRLAFRELGLAIGLSGLEWMERATPEAETDARRASLFDELRGYLPLADEIVAHWRDAGRGTADDRDGGTRDIDDVMLATALVPRGFLALH